MAVRLNDVQTQTKNNSKRQREDRQKSLRPWESFDKLGNQTRTVAANEAVVKAKKTVEKNNEMVLKLREGFISGEKTKVIDSYFDSKNSVFDKKNLETTIVYKKISTDSKIKNFFKQMLTGADA